MIAALRAHFARYPGLTPQDAVKLLYQAVFGPGHLVQDEKMAARRLSAERAECEKHDGAAFEPIGGGFARMHLGARELEGVSDELLTALFLRAAKITGEKATFLAALEELEDMGEMPFSPAELREYLAAYRAGGCPMVSHSEAYRAAYSPAYRVVLARDARLLPILKQLPSAGVIAIDGRAASGKTTLAADLQEILGSPIVHMDDFFLPPEKRTPERLAEPGGNVDYERFAAEVLPGLQTGAEFSCGVFDCDVMEVTGQAAVPASNRRIVEGSYSHHPTFGDYADLRVFLTVTPEEQMARILTRNGAEMAEMFADRWIPMEERYFEAFGIRQKADVVI